jgi:hypothetical protein
VLSVKIEEAQQETQRRVTKVHVPCPNGHSRKLEAMVVTGSTIKPMKKSATAKFKIRNTGTTDLRVLD